MADTSVFIIHPVSPALKDYAKKLKKRGGTTVQEFQTTREAVPAIRHRGQGVVLIHVENEKTAKSYSAIMRLLKPLIDRGSVEVVATSAVQTPAVQEALKNLGVAEVFPPRVKLDILDFKVKRVLKNVEAYVHVPSADERVKIQSVEPLEEPSDLWFSKGGGVHYAEGRFSVNLVGPGADTGQWVSSEKHWVWNPRSDAAVWSGIQGTWIFEGSRPRIQGGLWFFEGPKPRLYFRSHEGVKIKMEGEGMVLKLARDSQATLPMLTKVLSTLTDDPRECVAVKGLMGRLAFEPLNEPMPKIAKTQVLSTPQGNMTFEFPLEQFGSRGGKWKFVASNIKRGKLYVYVPFKLQIKEIKDPATEMTEFWTYEGMDRPTFNRNATKFVFRGNPPVETKLFSDLPLLVQEYLGRISGRTEGLVPQENFGEVEIVDEQLSPEPYSSPINFAQTLRDRVAEKGDYEAVDRALQTVEETLEDVSFKALEEEENLKRGPEGLLAKEVGKPTLSPVALAYLMSELVGHRRMDRESMTKRFCSYLSASCGGLRVEMWVHYRKFWYCVGTFNGTAGKCLKAVKKACDEAENAGRLVKPSLTGAVAKDILVSVISDGLEVKGAMVVLGNGAAKVDRKYLDLAAETTWGLVESFVVDGPTLAAKG